MDTPHKVYAVHYQVEILPQNHPLRQNPSLKHYSDVINVKQTIAGLWYVSYSGRTFTARDFNSQLVTPSCDFDLTSALALAQSLAHQELQLLIEGKQHDRVVNNLYQCGNPDCGCASGAKWASGKV